MVAEENPVRSYVLNGFIHTRTYQPLHDADFASEVVHGGLGGAWAGAVIGGASAWYRTPVLRAIFAQAVRGAGWYGV